MMSDEYVMEAFSAVDYRLRFRNEIEHAVSQ
jgi:hypothetical protein